MFDKNHKEVIGFADYMNLNLFVRQIFYGGISLKNAEEMQVEMESKLKELEKYKPKIQERKDLQKVILDNGQKLFEGRDAIIEAFTKRIFQFYDSNSE